MSDERDIDPMRGTAEWVIAIVGSTLAKGVPRSVRPSDATVAEAAETLLIALRCSGEDHVVTDDGVWTLAWLEDEEVIELARVLVGRWFEGQHLELKWDDGGD